MDSGSTTDFNSSILDNNTPSAANNDFLTTLKSINATTWIIIILVLAFLGINVFVYLANATTEIDSFLKPVIKTVLGLSTYVSASIIGITASGAKTVVQGTADVLDTGLTSISNEADNITSKNNNSDANANVNQSTTPTSLKFDKAQKNVSFQEPDSLSKAINNADQSKSNYEADESTSTIQSGVSKSGWCYIGEDRGFRSCVEVSQRDMCMSGDIFPNKDICVNPSLRQ